MEEVRIKLSILWICLMLIYLLGDVLRIFAGDFKPGEIEGMQVSPAMYVGIAALMVIPIIMAFLSLTVSYPLIRWASIVVAIFFFLFNLVSLRGYAPYDQFLLVVSFVFNALTVWHAWKWVPPGA